MLAEHVGSSSRGRIHLRGKEPVSESSGRGTFGPTVAIYTRMMFP